MLEIIIPERHQILIELRPYFEEEEYLLDLDDEELITAYSEMKFCKFGLVHPVDWFDETF